MNYLGVGCKGKVDGRALDVKVPIDVKKEPFLFVKIYTLNQNLNNPQ